MRCSNVTQGWGAELGRGDGALRWGAELGWGTELVRGAGMGRGSGMGSLAYNLGQRSADSVRELLALEHCERSKCMSHAHRLHGKLSICKS